MCIYMREDVKWDLCRAVHESLHESTQQVPPPRSSPSSSLILIISSQKGGKKWLRGSILLVILWYLEDYSHLFNGAQSDNSNSAQRSHYHFTFSRRSSYRLFGRWSDYNSCHHNSMSYILVVSGERSSAGAKWICCFFFGFIFTTPSLYPPE